ncbi:hypothetical protein [Natrinema salifodinae]|uniref:Uncharacterized protein n=1 Tax=Natrinema salifodinae TaxID=1202768 RepID=A0A1I0LY03_9EURY|nr:hypothetical protein [Natrinema salifodinae]SEV80708.1 hypothetical protein SAMN05216285_0142 [Natrinema salifodinae]
MPTDERPSPPTDVDRVGREALRELADRDPETLRAASTYLADLADWKDRTDAAADERDESESGDDGDGDTCDGAPSSTDTADYPDGVPERASVSVDEIGGTEYRYYQWREGDEIRSKTVRR